MSKQLLTILSLAVLVSIVLTACDHTPTPTPVPAQTTPTPVPTPTTPPKPTSTPTKSPVPTPTIPPKPTPTHPVSPVGPTPPRPSFTPPPKPPLKITNIQTVTQAIGFVFSDRSIPLKAATGQQFPVTYTMHNDPMHTYVALGYVEIGKTFERTPPNIPASIYMVSVEPCSSHQRQKETLGFLTPVIGTGTAVTVSVECSMLTPNPARKDSQDSTERVYVSITSDTVCFAVDQNGQWWRYCGHSSEGHVSVRANFPGGPLSVRANFPDEFRVLTETVQAAAKQLLIPESELALELTVGEMEHPENIKDCNQNAANCGPDIIGTPVITDVFNSKYLAARASATEVPTFTVTAGVVSVMRDMQLNGTDILTGAYKVEFWFTRNDGLPDGYEPAVDPSPDEFVGATISGRRGVDGSWVAGQQIPAVEAQFLPSDQYSQSQISAWHLFNWCCFWQRRCP